MHGRGRRRDLPERVTAVSPGGGHGNSGAPTIGASSISVRCSARAEKLWRRPLREAAGPCEARVAGLARAGAAHRQHANSTSIALSAICAVLGGRMSWAAESQASWPGLRNEGWGRASAPGPPRRAKGASRRWICFGSFCWKCLNAELLQVRAFTHSHPETHARRAHDCQGSSILAVGGWRTLLIASTVYSLLRNMPLALPRHHKVRSHPYFLSTSGHLWRHCTCLFRSHATEPCHDRVTDPCQKG
jgi:hypothetical protein